MTLLLWLACTPDDVVVHNDPPELAIVTPVDLDSFTEGFAVTFEVIVDDDQTPLEDLTTFWVSDRDGELAGETSLGERLFFETTALSQGEQRITLYATDASGGVGETSVLLTIRDNTAPVLTVLEPDDGSAVAEGGEVLMTVRVEDETEPDLSVMALTWWLDGVPLEEAPKKVGGDGTATHPFTDLALGDHDLWVEVVDTPGLSAFEARTVSVLEPDADGDGHTTDRLGGGDCDDDDAAVNPDAVEVCDDQDTDEDCSGAADDADPGVTDPALRYFDGDGDGYGDAELWTCEEAADAGGDCDDTDPAVNPSAEEICGDGVDNDCDGSSSGCRLEGDLGLYAADLLYYGSQDNGEVGHALDVGDLDGDGLADLALGAHLHDGGDNNSGAVWIAHAGGYGELFLDEVGVLFEGTDASDNAGAAVAVIGDQDGDGSGEVLVGAPESDLSGTASGVVYLLMGPATAGASLAAADALLTAEDGGDELGTAVADAGDVDGDGVRDLLLGAPYEASAHSQGGAGYLLLGPVTGDLDLSLADGKFRAEDSADHLGSAVAGVGDLDADGYDDLLLGAPDEDTAGSAAGAAYVVLGAPTSTWNQLSLRMSSADAKLVGDESQAGAGAALHGPGDLDGDGYAEVLIGAWDADTDTGRLHLVHGPLTGSFDLGADSTATWAGSRTDERLGFALATGDLDADGLPDLVAGAPERDATASDSGAAWLLFGPWGTGLMTMETEAQGHLDGVGSGTHTGYAVGVGDVDGDGKDDVVVGSPKEDTNGANSGTVTVTLGRGL